MRGKVISPQVSGVMLITEPLGLVMQYVYVLVTEHANPGKGRSVFSFYYCCT